ncbi:MAG: hypothetical protein AB7F35_05045 [Acetobacteraceae bacterium]
MAVFKPNQPVIQTDPMVKVEVSRDNPLPIGPNRFRLVVVDDDGKSSEPTFLEVIVLAPTDPTAVLDVVNEDGKRIEPQVPFGQTFILSGGRSSDVEPGKVVEYQFTLVDRG